MPPKVIVNGKYHPRPETPGQTGTDNVGDGRGGRGGTGEGPRIPQRLISIKSGSEDKIPELNMEIEDFSKKYCLGTSLSDLLKNKGFEMPCALLEVNDTDLSRAGFKVGHIAELRWALKKMAGKEVQKIQVGTTQLYGGIGGRGGQGRKAGGIGGFGEAPVVPQGLIHWFRQIWGGIGGEGGTDGTGGETQASGGTSQAFTRTHNARKEDTLLNRIRNMLPYFFGKASESNSERTWLFGGTGGKGGRGTHSGGEGGLGEAPKIGIESISLFSRIFGGIGGLGGFGDLFGGQGGRGQGSTFHELLVCVDENARSAKPTPLAKFHIGDSLRQRLYDQGFVTVGGLFEVTGNDLREVGFEIGDISTLKVQLKAFLRRDDDVVPCR
ncbi:hypothetical protein B0H11DRAFT_1925635 [Mycena galericulata]|nr:hypothetical protein B0H11DRAFT_1925635 [Mycena galericulata]